MEQVSNKQGLVLLDLIQMGEPELPFSSSDRPIAFALMILIDNGKVLLLYNRKRNQWELPGGKVEPGESPRQAAIRETKEETNQVVGTVEFVGLMKLLFPDGVIHHSALFIGETDGVADFTPNEEAAGILWWEPGTHLDSLDGIDEKLINELL